jgi:endonuclease YncB( thermonuclease family)
MSVLIMLASAVIPSGSIFICTATHVWDGDGPVWCAEGPKIRLSGIAARETDGTCKPNQPCPRASAEAARDTLVRLLGGARGRTATGHILVGGTKLSCTSVGSGGHERTAAWCRIGTRDLSCLMVASGTVLRWDKYWRRHRCP